MISSRIVRQIMSALSLKVTGNALNIEYYFWWRDDCFGLLIHHDRGVRNVAVISYAWPVIPV